MIDPESILHAYHGDHSDRIAGDASPNAVEQLGLNYSRLGAVRFEAIFFSVSLHAMSYPGVMHPSQRADRHFW